MRLLRFIRFFFPLLFAVQSAIAGPSNAPAFINGVVKKSCSSLECVAQFNSFPPGMFLGAGKGAPGGVAPATQTFESFATEASGGSTITYTAMAFGAAASNRVLAIIPCSRNPGNSTVLSATIDGVSASQAASAAGSGAADLISTDIWYASDPSNTSGNVVVVWSSATTRTGVYLYSILTTTPTPSNGNGGAINTGTTITKTLIVPANGIGIAGYCDQSTGSTLSFTNATQDASNALSGATSTYEAGHATGTGSISITGTSSVSSNSKGLSLAAWGP